MSEIPSLHFQMDSWGIVFRISSLINFAIVYIWPIYQSLIKKIWFTILSSQRDLQSVPNIDLFAKYHLLCPNWSYQVHNYQNVPHMDYYNSFFHEIIARNHMPFLKISNFVHSSPNFQYFTLFLSFLNIFCPFSPLLLKLAHMTMLSIRKHAVPQVF